MKIDGTSVHLLVDHTNELKGVLNLQALRKWLEGRSEFAADVPIRPDAVTQRDIRFFGSTPCWFDGCEELRKQYNEELSKIGGAACGTGCEKGTLIRKYLKLVAQAQNAS